MLAKVRKKIDPIAAAQGARLKVARDAAGWRSARAAAIECGWPESTYRAHEAGTRTIGQDDAERYARRFRQAGAQITGRQILYGDDDGPDLVEVPLLDWVAASSFRDVAPTTAADAEKWLVFRDLPPGDYFALRVNGDSMDRIAPDGSIIIINRLDRDLRSRRFYVFLTNTETTFKQFRRDGVMRLQPFSTNPMHDPIFVDEESVTPVGRVVRIVTDV